MLVQILISSENGSSMKTYGVNKLVNYNMKFTFLHIAFIGICVNLALAELEIYPGLKYNPSQLKRSTRLNNNDRLIEEPWNVKNAPIDDYDGSERKDQEYELSVPERLRIFQDLMNWNIELANRRPPQPINRLHYDNRQRFENADKGFGTISNSQLLDDVRMYPQEDDFSFKDEEEGAIIPKSYDDKSNEQDIYRPSYNQLNFAKTRPVDDELSFGSNDRTTKQHGIDFAYAPPDPRFYDSSEQTATKDTRDGLTIFSAGTLRHPDFYQRFKPKKVQIIPRSDEKTTTENRIVYNSENNYDVASKDRSGQIDVVDVKSNMTHMDTAGVYIIAVVAGISAAATVGLIAVGIGWYNLQKHVKNASDVDYPAYGVTGPNKDASPSGDRRLAQSAQMYHYQHQKQQILAMENRVPVSDRHGSVSEADSDEENEEGDYTVYECPGLAPTGEMEVKNPLFQDDPTPAQTPPVKASKEEKKNDVN